jgi:hypothetical protein
MYLKQRIIDSVLPNPQTLTIIVSMLATVGVLLELLGGVWDASSHAVRAPEQFWSIQHAVVYSGVSTVVVSSILGFFMLHKKIITGRTKSAVKIIILGSILQIAAGYGDSISHDLYGIDGLISWSHQPLELGLVLSALGGYLLLSNRKNDFFKKLLPVSILAVLASSCWLVFSLSLFVSAVPVCTLVYEIFSSGCAVL